MNHQPIEKFVALDSGFLQVHSIFLTLQGEGPFAGRPAVFIRLAGCNLQCPLCDTDYTSSRTHMTHSEIVDACLKLVAQQRFVEQYNNQYIAVITGGEPFRQNINMLTRYLHTARFDVQIETNGTVMPSEKFPFKLATIVCSPKTSKVAAGLERHVSAWKYVVDVGHVDENDGLPTKALGHASLRFVARPPFDFSRRHIYVQPADLRDEGKNRANLEAAIDICKKYGYTLCIQQHKIIGLP